VGITFRHADRICHACRRACFTISKGRTSAFLTSMRLCPVRMQRHRISQRTDTEDLALGDTAVDILIWASGLHLSSAHGSEQQVCEERLVGLRFSPLFTPKKWVLRMLLVFDWSFLRHESSNHTLLPSRCQPSSLSRGSRLLPRLWRLIKIRRAHGSDFYGTRSLCTRSRIRRACHLQMTTHRFSCGHAPRK
jgi:hypothetical protein